MDETKEPGKEAGKERIQTVSAYCAPINFDQMDPMDYPRRLLLTDLLSRPEILSNGELRYRRFLRIYHFGCIDPEKWGFLEGFYYLPPYGINNRACWSHSSEIAEQSSVTAVIPRLRGFIKVHVNSFGKGRTCFFRHSYLRYEPFDKQSLSIHVLEQDCGFLPLMLKEMTFPGNHICCYGTVTDPEIYDDGFKEILMGCSRGSGASDEASEVKMSFKGTYLLFLDARNCFFQKLPVHNPPEARVLEGDFSVKGGNQQRPGSGERMAEIFEIKLRTRPD